MEVVRQTRVDGLTKQMAEQQDSAPAEADLQEGGAFALYPNDIVAKRRNDAPARSGQLVVGTNVQDGSGMIHAALDGVLSACVFGHLPFSAPRTGGRCILLPVF
jgi:hypothetical protein